MYNDKENRKMYIRRKQATRAIVMNCPKKVLTAFLGEELQVELSFANGGRKKYEQGFHMESALDEAAKAVFAPIKIPVAEVEPNEQFTVTVPVKIAAGADINSTNTFVVGLTDEKGKEIGFAVPIKVLVIEKLDQAILYDKAKQLISQIGMVSNEQGLFERAIAALKETAYDIDKAAAIIAQPTADKA